jgi:hypothetical protein
MTTLTLCTRHREGQFETDAVLLVYDQPVLSGADVGSDIREVLDLRPNTSHVFVLAPFHLDGVAATAAAEGAALQRAGPLTSIATLELDASAGQGQRVVYRPVVVGGADVLGSVLPLPVDLREGWLFDLFSRNKGRVDAPAGVHFGKGSQRHSEKFLRASSVLLSSRACALVGYFALAESTLKTPRRVLVDTAPLLAVAFAMQRIAVVRQLWAQCPAAESFSSYGGLDALPVLSKSDLFLVSASTSGGLAEKLNGQGADPMNIVTLFQLDSETPRKTLGRVVCDLTHRPGRAFGYPAVKNYSAGSCPLCDRGSLLAALEGDEFLLQRRAVKRLQIVGATQSRQSREAFEQLSRRDALSVRLHHGSARTPLVQVDLSSLLKANATVGVDFVRLLQRFTPHKPAFIVLVGVNPTELEGLLESSGMADTLAGVLRVSANDLGSQKEVAGGSALVCVGILSDHAELRQVNAQLRTKLPGGRVAYLTAIVLVESGRNLRDLRTFLSYGEHGPDTFTSRQAMILQLPRAGEVPSAWEAELALLRKLSDGHQLPEGLLSRKGWLEQTPVASKGLFLTRAAELALARDFVFLDTSAKLERISQGDVFALISSLVAAERNDRRGLDEGSLFQASETTWGQSVYGHTVLCPSNFQRFNDAVLRAALLRSAAPAELDYSIDDECSAEMLAILSAELEAWTLGQGATLPEFLLSLACERLRLTPSHGAAFAAACRKADLTGDVGLLANAAHGWSSSFTEYPAGT